MRKNKIIIFIAILTLITLIPSFTLLSCKTETDKTELDKAKEKIKELEEKLSDTKTAEEVAAEEIPGLKIGNTIEAEGIEIYIPPDTQDSQPDITVSKVNKALPPPPEGSEAIGSAYEIDSDGELTGPVLITIPYDPSDLAPDASEESLYIATRVGDNWEIVPNGFIDTEANTVSVSVEHFSDFWTMAKQTGEAIYNTASTIAKTVGSDQKTTGTSYKSLPDDIKNDLSRDFIKPEDVSAITKYKFSLITKIGHSLNSYLNGLTKLSGLAIAALDGTKRAVAESVVEAVAYESFDYTGNETGTYTLIIYDTLNLLKEIGLLALDAAVGVEMVALKGTDYLAARVMDDINSEMHDAFRNLIKLNPNSTNRLELYAVCIDAQPKDYKPGAKGIMFYYFDEGQNRWVRYYEDLFFWVVEFEPDKEMMAKSTQTTVKEYETTAAQTEQTQKTAKEEITTVETVKEIPQGPMTVYINPEGTGDYKTLEEAVKAVSAGSTIFLDSGTYYLSDDVYIDKDIEIVGSREDLVDVRYDGSGDDYFLDIGHYCTIIIEDITFTAEGNGVYHILDIENTEIQINNCRFMGASDDAIYIDGDTTGSIKDCEFSHNGRGIFVKGNGYITIENNVITDNRNGIGMNADGKIIDNNCSWNTYDGISTGSEVSDILIENNICSNNGGDGICFSWECNGIARNNECFNNEKGIAIRNEASPTLEYNICYDNEEVGILFTDDSSGMARQNDCYNNGIGIAVWIDALPQLVDNYCYDNYEKDIDS